MRILKFLAPVLAVPLALSFFACSGTTADPSDGGGSGGGGSGGGACQTFDYKNYTAPAAQLTLRKDVMPIFMLSCSLASSCHSTGSTHPPNLGPAGGMPDADVPMAALQAIITSLGQSSEQVSTMKYVVPGKPEESYLMNKIDGSANCMGFACVCETSKSCIKGPNKPCGDIMPQSSPPLEAARIKTIRDWIKQGANM